LLNINKEELKKKFIEKDWDYVFDKVYKISFFLLSNKFRIYDYDKKIDMGQECVLNFYMKIQQGKVDPNNNVFSFIWKNSTFRILEILRKENNRNRIARFIPYDSIDFEVYRESNEGEKYKKAQEQ